MNGLSGTLRSLIKRGQECSLDAMQSKDWLQPELLRGVSDPTLQKRLMQERDPKLEDLVKIATLWQDAEQALQSFCTEVSEYVRQGVHEANFQPVAEKDGGTPDEHNIWRLSEYKREGKSNWRNQLSGRTQPPPPRQNQPNQCIGCGAQGERMHPRDQCPARGLICYICGKKRALQKRM